MATVIHLVPEARGRSGKLSDFAARRIAVEALRDPRTVRAVLEPREGRGTCEISRLAVVEAAKRLGLVFEQEVSAA